VDEPRAGGGEQDGGDCDDEVVVVGGGGVVHGGGDGESIEEGGPEGGVGLPRRGLGERRGFCLSSPRACEW